MVADPEGFGSDEVGKLQVKNAGMEVDTFINN
jgi:hypothetical protein